MAYGIHGSDAGKIALALAIGLLIGFEREWSNKDAGIRTFAIVALAGALAALASPALAMVALAGVVTLMVFVNLRALRTSGTTEITTAAALLLVYILGVLVGQGNYFAPVAAAIVATLLLAWKLELHKFAGELRPSEVHGAVW
ncbi:MAG: MgtC/SapB family protein, partial [Chloroflexota bacterium]